jgi:cytochrome c oxidase subunit II
VVDTRSEFDELVSTLPADHARGRGATRRDQPAAVGRSEGARNLLRTAAQAAAPILFASPDGAWSVRGVFLVRESGHVRKPLLAGVVAFHVCLASGCSEAQSTLAPESEASRRIATLWWIMMIGGWVLFAIVVMLLAIALLRRRRRGGRPFARGRAPSERRSERLILFGGVVAPVLVLSALFAGSVMTLAATSAPRNGTAAVTVEVVGHQWFWEIRYPGTDAVTANEVHIPAQTPVRLRVRTVDVIHSFWVPRLNRKIDLIPGQANEILLRADKPGRYRGQCAEFCGLQHANMSFYVYADPPARFRAWLANEAAPARKPAGDARAGRDVFLTEGCAACHTIRGTPADGDVGPDLTHLARRSTLAALTIPNRPGYLGGWVLDPQHVKPGNKMPALNLSGEQLQSLLDYLTSLR